MIGYMKPQKHAFDSECKELYQALYCGLCRNLNYKYGVRGTLLVNYEIVDLLLIIEALSENEPSMMKLSCSITPLYWRGIIGYNDSSFQLGAAISVIIAAFELRDNIIDDDKFKDKAAMALLKSAINKVKVEYPEEWKQIEIAYNEYMKLEQQSKNNGSGFYTVLSACGEITRKIGEIVGKSLSDEYAYRIGVMMYYWGEWIYLLDAIDDYERDRKAGAYNPLMLSDCPGDLIELLQELEENAFDIVENLPIRRYQHLIEELFGMHFPEKRALVCQRSKYRL